MVWMIQVLPMFSPAASPTVSPSAMVSSGIIRLRRLIRLKHITKKAQQTHKPVALCSDIASGELSGTSKDVFIPQIDNGYHCLFVLHVFFPFLIIGSFLPREKCSPEIR